MSREFGSYTTGYFHAQMQTAAEDLSGGRYPLTREWSKFFEEFQHIAYDIASAEAGDCGQDRPIMETIVRIKKLQSVLYDIEQHVRVYKEVAERAVRDYDRATQLSERGYIVGEKEPGAADAGRVKLQQGGDPSGSSPRGERGD